LFTRSSRSFVVLARFGNTQLRQILSFGSNVLQRQFDLLPFAMHWQVVILGKSVAATIRLIATAISRPVRASNFDMTLSHRPKLDISEILNGSPGDLAIEAAARRVAYDFEQMRQLADHS
jgi:hypothetical protein